MTPAEIAEMQADMLAGTPGDWTYDRGFVDGPARSYSECYYVSHVDARRIARVPQYEATIIADAAIKAAQAAEIARWQSVAIGPLSAAAIIAKKDAEIERLRKALADIIPTNRLHGVTPDSAGKQIWFDGPSAKIARAALEGAPK